MYEHIDSHHIIKIASFRVVIGAKNDSIVPHEHTARLAKQLEAKMLFFEKGGHFLADDGFIEFPEVFNEVCIIAEH